MRIRSNPKNGKYWRKHRGIAGDNLGKGSKKKDIKIVFFDSKNIAKPSGKIFVSAIVNWHVTIIY